MLQGSRIYGFIFGVLNDALLAEAVLLNLFRKKAAGYGGEREKDMEMSVIKNLVPELEAVCGRRAPREITYPELHHDARLQWALQILAGLELEERALILMRDQLEWSLEKIGTCLSLHPQEAGNRLRLARLHFLRQKEILLNRRKRC